MVWKRKVLNCVRYLEIIKTSTKGPPGIQHPTNSPVKRKKPHYLQRKRGAKTTHLLQSNHPQKRRRNPSPHNPNPPRATSLAGPTRTPRLRRARTPTRTPRRSLIHPRRLEQDTLHHLPLPIIIALHLARQRAVPARQRRERLQPVEGGDAAGDAVLGGGGGEGGEGFLDLGFFGEGRGGGGGGEGGELRGYVGSEGGGVGCELLGGVRGGFGGGRGGGDLR